MKCFFPQNQVKTKKKVFIAIWDYIIRPEFEGFIRAGWLLFCLIIQRLNLDGGDADSRWGDASPRVSPTI